MTNQADMTTPPAFSAWSLAGDGRAPALLPDLAMLEAWLAADGGAALLVHAGPAAVVAGLVAQGATLREARLRWRADAAAYMAVQRRHRDRVAVIAQPRNARALEALRVAFAARWPDRRLPDLPLATASPAAEPGANTARETAGSHALCGLSLALDPEAVELMDAIEAATTGPAPQRDDPDSMLESVATDLLSPRPDPQVAVLQRQLAEAEGVSEQVAVLRQQLSDAQGVSRQVADLRRQLDDSEMLRTVLMQQVKDLEQALRGAADATAKARREGQAKLDEVYASTSWRITGPMRALKTRLARG